MGKRITKDILLCDKGVGYLNIVIVAYAADIFVVTHIVHKANKTAKMVATNIYKEKHMQYANFIPGQICPVSGIWRMSISWVERTVVEGEPFPPTVRPGEAYSLVRQTRH